MSQNVKPFSVLISLYAKEDADHFTESMKSIFSQTALPSEIVLVLDGPIGENLEAAVENCRTLSPCEMKIVRIETNQGLGKALAVGVEQCSFELIARMDTDDIARTDRFSLQLEAFDQHPELGICGSHILEFEGTPSHTVARRRVPQYHDEIVAYQKKRDAFNHMTVMFKRQEVLAAGNYRPALLMEDSLLWAHMLQNGSIGYNIDDYLVYARVDAGFIDRRGGWSYFKKYRLGRKAIKETGFIGTYDYYYTLFIQLIVSCMPCVLRRFVFRNLLRG